MSRIVLLLQLDIAVLIIQLLRVCLDTVIRLICSGFLGVRVLSIVLRGLFCLWSILHAQDGAGSNTCKDEDHENNKNEGESGLHLHVWTELFGDEDVILLAVGLSENLVAGDAFFGLEFVLEHVG